MKWAKRHEFDEEDIYTYTLHIHTHDMHNSNDSNSRQEVAMANKDN